MRLWVSSVKRNEDRKCGETTRRTRRTPRTSFSCRASTASLLRSGPAEEPGGFDRQDRRRGGEECEVRELGGQSLPEVVQEPHHQAADHRPLEAPHPPDDHHHEGVGEDLEVGAWGAPPTP